jgi:regulatory protein
LNEIALHYVGRFATSRAKLSRYLLRKIRERGWDDDAQPDVEGVVERLAGYGYVDDAGYAEGQARSLSRRGYGLRRVQARVSEAGIAEQDRDGAIAIAEDEALASALRFAARRRWGPYAAATITDPAQRDKAIAAFLRAGHSFAMAQRLLSCGPGDIPDGMEN